MIGQWGQGELNMSRDAVQWNSGPGPGRPPPGPSQPPPDDQLATQLSPADPSDWDGDLAPTQLTPAEVTVPLSVCALPCDIGEVKMMRQVSRWVCGYPQCC